ncbi:MAG: RCC1 repeat-containing protein, partial [Lentisphaerae bacterium]|nr:RCC1 repeat-containing protein [Lentisphaerota bacterium]
IAASGNYYTYSLALKSDGTVWAWGDNTYGQLGDGTTTRRLTPTKVSGLSGVSAIVAGHYSAMALKTDGTVWAWGYNVSGQLGDGTTTSRSAPVQVKLSDGSALTNVVGIGAGSGHAVARTSDGSVWAWGNNGYGQLGITDPNIYPEEVTGLTGVTNVAAGSSHTVALKSDGSVWAWGYNSSGQVGDGTTTSRNTPVQVKQSGGASLSGVAGIAARENRTVALKTDGTVWAWGDNWAGQLGDGTMTTRLNPAKVIMQDGAALSNVTAVAAGSIHTLALKDDGTVWAWGYNAWGQIGDGTQYTNRLNPVQVLMADRTPLSGVIAIAAGNGHSLAVQEDGSVWAWGDNSYGQLGDGTTTMRLNPVEIPDFFGVVVIGAGSDHTLAVRERQPSVRVSASVKGVTVTEGGTATFQVKLTAAPAATVTVIARRTSGDADITVQSGSNLVFTTANWSTYQTVTLAAAQDADAENGSAVISLMGVDVGAVVTATENDNDAPLTVGAGAGGTAVPVGITNVTKY